MAGSPEELAATETAIGWDLRYSGGGGLTAVAVAPEPVRDRAIDAASAHLDVSRWRPTKEAGRGQKGTADAQAKRSHD